jgi:putative PIN family toxin of toxin-antitoxin system
MKLKIILDTNVFISGVFFSGPPYLILEGWRDGKILLVVSPEIFEEYQRVGEILAQDYPSINLKPFLEYVLRNAEIFYSPKLDQPICDDPDDDKFFACALASRSSIIVSGDKHLLKASGYKGIQVLKPRDFIDRHLSPS